MRLLQEEINKFEIVRTVLARLNDTRGKDLWGSGGRSYTVLSNLPTSIVAGLAINLRPRGLVAAIRDVVNQKDSFTRMNLERKKERQVRLSETQHAVRKKQEKMSKIEGAKNEFYGLFGASLTAQERGKKLETALNNLFDAYGILVQKAFHLVGDGGEGIVEQIDGVIELKGDLYFVEMKWFHASRRKGGDLGTPCSPYESCRRTRDIYLC